MRLPRHRIPAIAVALLLACSIGWTEDGRRESLREEITRLERELEQLGQREKGLLGELQRLERERQLREAEHEEVALRLERIRDRMAAHDVALGRLSDAQELRKNYLALQLRSIYKAGSEQWLERLLTPGEAQPALSGAGYAAYLSDRDAQVLREFQADAHREREERAAVEQAEAELSRASEELTAAREQLDAARRQHGRRLDQIQRDQAGRRTAIQELREAADALAGVVDDLGGGSGSPNGSLDVRKFRGLLDWPAQGPVTTGFGNRVHPRFKTEVPHPGWDVDAPFGSDVVAVFDGQVVFADWMRGYGLTVIVDHGFEVLSIYAHASILLVEQGDRVRQGQLLGKVGETGSLRGPFLYFELRVDGQPQDPGRWLRKR